MEYIKATEQHTRIDVYFDGEKYVFINAFHGLVAIARREGFTEFSSDGMTAYCVFNVEKTKKTIDYRTIEKIICKQESLYVKTCCKFHYKEIEAEDLPYFVGVKLDKRG